MSQANPTKATLDAAEHEANLETQRKKRKDSAVEMSSTTHGGDKMRQLNLPSSPENDYPFDEAEDQFEPRATKKAKSVAEEVNE